VENLVRALLVVALFSSLAGGFASAQSDSADIEVEVSAVCRTPAVVLSPGVQDDLETDVGVVGLNTTANFTVSLSNEGNIDANITSYNFTNVTRENRSYTEDSGYDNIVSADGTNVSPKLLLPGPDAEGDLYLANVLNGTVIRQEPISGSFSVPVTIGGESLEISSFFRGPDRAVLNVTAENGFEKGQFYAAHLEVEAECRGRVNDSRVAEGNFSDVVHSSFYVVDVPGTRTVPQNFSETGGEDVNDTVPQDVNRTGEQGQPVEGDSDQPGQTPTPEPEPEPRPQVEVEPVNRTYTVNRGSFGPASLEVRNIGNSSVGAVTLSPQTAELPGDWQVRNASVGNLSVGENATRDVFIRPPENAEPRRYVVPVEASNDNGALDVDFFYVDVNRTRFPTSIGIVEFPPSATIEQGENQTLPVLVENTGREPLFNVTAELQNAEDCGRVQDSGVLRRLDVNESGSLAVRILDASAPASCDDVNATLVVSSERSAFAFSDISLSTIRPAGLIPTAQRPPFLAMIWSALLAGYALVRKRFDLSGVYDVLLLLMIAGEVVILTLLFVESFGLSSPFLPF